MIVNLLLCYKSMKQKIILVNNLVPSYSSNIPVMKKCECSAPVLWRL